MDIVLRKRTSGVLFAFNILGTVGVISPDIGLVWNSGMT